VEIRIESVVALERTVEYTRSLVEVGDVPVLLQRVQGVGDRHFVLGFQARPPEPTAQFHLGMVYFFQPAQRRPISRGSNELNSRHHRHGEREPGEARECGLPMVSCDHA
jgi:hypothetical protein